MWGQAEDLVPYSCWPAMFPYIFPSALRTGKTNSRSLWIVRPTSARSISIMIYIFVCVPLIYDMSTDLVLTLQTATIHRVSTVLLFMMNTRLICGDHLVCRRLYFLWMVLVWQLTFLSSRGSYICGKYSSLSVVTEKLREQQVHDYICTFVDEVRAWQPLCSMHEKIKEFYM